MKNLKFPKHGYSIEKPNPNWLIRHTWNCAWHITGAWQMFVHLCQGCISHGKSKYVTTVEQLTGFSLEDLQARQVGAGMCKCSHSEPGDCWLLRGVGGKGGWKQEWGEGGTEDGRGRGEGLTRLVLQRAWAGPQIRGGGKAREQHSLSFSPLRTLCSCL